MADELKPLDPEGWPTRVRQRTPARLFVGRAGSSYRTESQLELRSAHAAAVDAVQDEVELKDFGGDFVERLGLFDVSTEAQTKQEYLVRPDRGRRLSDFARAAIQQNVVRGCDLQIAIGDGLSAAAVKAQVPLLLPSLVEEAESRGWSLSRPFLIHRCRVGVMNDIGDLLSPNVVVLLIGERPGLATAESLSAYIGFRPRAGHTDANRNLVSNIHARGVGPSLAAKQIIEIAKAMITQQISGPGLNLRSLTSLT